MILAYRNGEWFLAAFANHIRGCNLSINRVPAHDATHFRLWQGSVYVWSNAPTLGITFFPEIRYKGMRVYPVRWKLDSIEPILRVHSGYGARDYPPGNPFDIEAKLKAEGWEWDAREGGEGYVHVDDLEKIKGPPPGGPF